MRTNIQLAIAIAKAKPKLFGHIFTKGDIVTYRDYRENREKLGIYISHRSFSTWHNGIEHHNCNHTIKIIQSDGTTATTSWIKPIQETK